MRAMTCGAHDEYIIFCAQQHTIQFSINSWQSCQTHVKEGYLKALGMKFVYPVTEPNER